MTAHISLGMQLLPKLPLMLLRPEENDTARRKRDIVRRTRRKLISVAGSKEIRNVGVTVFRSRVLFEQSHHVLCTHAIATNEPNMF